MGLQDYIFNSNVSNIISGTGVRSETYIVTILFNSAFNSFSYRSEHYAITVGAIASDNREVISANIQIYINDQLIVSENATSPGGFTALREAVFANTVSCPTASKVRVVASTWAGANSRFYQATSSIDETYFLYTASETLTVIKNTTNNSNIILPSSGGNNAALKIIKKITSSGYAFITSEFNDRIEDSIRKSLFLNQYECGTFISNGNQWLLANYYNNNIPSTTTSFPNGTNKITTAAVNRINVFNVNSFTARQSGDNGVLLPLPENGKMCIVVYAGNLSKKQDNNALLFAPTDSNAIDNRFNSVNNFPYIFTDANNKSTGIIFISDGRYWFIVGWNQTIGQGWMTDATPSGTSLLPATKYSNFYYSNTSPLTSNLNYVLPQTHLGGLTQCYILIIKNRNVTSGRGIVVYANTSGTNSPHRFNEEVNYIDNVFAGPNNYGCIWLVSENRGGSTVYWHPIVNLQT